MGMYANIQGQEVKFSGRLAKAINNIGVDTEDSVVVVPESKIQSLIWELAKLIDETTLSKGFSTQELYGFSTDVHKLSVIVTWLQSEPGETELVFA